jgi:hypothetical protein
MSGQDLSAVKDTPPVSLRGSLSLGGFFYNTTREFSPIQPFGYAFNANVNLSLHGWEIPFSISLNQQGSSFREPFNRIGISPKYKSLTMHLGHRNLYWSPFVFGGTTIYGGGFEFTPGKLRLGAMVGRLEPDFRFRLSGKVLPEYRRKTQAYKVGWGSENSHFDIVAMKGTDDESSLEETPDSIRRFIPAQENLAVGIVWQQKMLKDRLTWKSDLAVSAFTEDLRFEPIESDTLEALRWASDNLLAFNASTHATYAGEASLNWSANNFSLSGKYRRVMPEYRTFGANYLLTDLEAYTLNPLVYLWKGKASLGGSFGWQNNNLDNRLIRSTNRFIGALDVNLNLSEKWGVFAQYSNYSLEQQVVLDTLRQDSFAINQISHNFTFAPRFSVSRDRVAHSFFINANYQTFNDDNPLTAEFSENSLALFNLNYILTILEANVNIKASVNYLDFSSATFNNQQVGCHLGLTKSFGDRRFTLGIFGQFARTMADNFSADNLSYRLTGKLRVQKNSSLSFRYSGLENSREGAGFTESRGELSWRWRW